MTVKPAYSPAEAFVRRLAKKPWNGVRPAFPAVIPSEKDTAKYPKPTGTPSRIPSVKAVLLFIIQVN